jgi:thiopurine S-methyltransferase
MFPRVAAAAPLSWVMGMCAGGVGVCLASPASCKDKPDRLESWKMKWHEKYNGKPSFHKEEVNQHLNSFYLKVFFDAGKKRVLVPLCGKTVDLPFLAGKGHEVIGIEGVAKAIEEFAEEQFIVMQQAGWIDGRSSSTAGFRPYIANPQQSQMDLAILEGDFFNLTADKIGGPVDVIFDRASLVAVEPDSRQEYADVVKDTLKVRINSSLISSLTLPFVLRMQKNGKCLLVVVEYDQQRYKGPPFSVTKDDVNSLYLRRGFTVQPLLRKKETEMMASPRWSSTGDIYTVVYLLTKTSTE